jgi:cytochrome c oxidase subunit III
VKTTQSAIDVAALPTVSFRSKSLMTWGTWGFMVIEGWTLGLCVIAYLYVRHNFETWPPPRVPNPDVLIPTINVVLMVVSLVPAWYVARRARVLDKRGVTRGLIMSGILGVIILALRWFELWALNTRWDTNAYGSTAWLVVGMHATLLLIDVADTIVLAVFFGTRELPPHYFSDSWDNSLYWFFVVIAWIPLYALVFLGPYVL